MFKSSQFNLIVIGLSLIVSSIKVNSIASGEEKLEIDEKPIIDDIRDIEILTYFLLRNNYNKDVINSKLESLNQQLSSPSAASSPSLMPYLINDTINEMKLRQFINDIKNNKLSNFKKPPTEFVCEEHEHELNYYRNESSKLNCDKYEKLWQISLNCQSSQDLLNLLSRKQQFNHKQVNNSEKVIFNKALVRLCPLLLFQLNDKSCTYSREKNVNERLRPSLGAVWGFAILFVTIISFCSLVGVAIMPFLNKNSYLNVLNLFEGLAVGSLVGSAIFHLIPQAFDLVGQMSSQDYLWKALLIFAGIYLFFISERLMKIMVDIRKKRKLKEMDNFTSFTDNCEPKLLEMINKQSPNAIEYIETSQLNTTNNSSSSKKDHPNHKKCNNEHVLVKQSGLCNGKDGDNGCSITKLNTEISNNGTQAVAAGECTLIETINQQHNHTHMVMPGDSPVATVAWMIIFGDGFHNFIDGLSIGAAFSDSILSGISISVAVICEEFPHELGDFAVLIASGMSTRQAVGYNFLSACTCYIGMAFGIIVGDFTQGSTYIFAFAGGMFLYIALVDMMAELTSGLDEALKHSKAQMFKILFLQNLGMLLGVCTLFLLAKYSEHINFEGLAPPTSFFS